MFVSVSDAALAGALFCSELGLDGGQHASTAASMAEWRAATGQHGGGKRALALPMGL